MKFSARLLHLFGGRLVFAFIRNDALASYMRYPVSARFERVAGGGGAFVTLHVGNYFFNVDWV